jgi:septum formation protein
MQRIVLASQSPRRKQLLEWAEIEFDIIVPQTDESFPPEISLQQLPIHVAREKAKSIQAELSHERIILAADTVVVLNAEVIGKPVNRANAIEILQRLSGNQHQVITGVVILKGEKEIAFSDTTDVAFHELTTEQIIFYVDNYKPYDKAGAYAIQEWIGVVGIKSISGDFYNVMGLPVSRVVSALRQLSS